MEKDFQILQKCLGKSEDDVATVVHLVLRRVLTHFPGECMYIVFKCLS